MGSRPGGRRPTLRLAAVAVLGLVGGCGGSAQETVRANGSERERADSGEETPYWVGRHDLPDGYQALTMDEFDGQSVVYYGPLEQGDGYDADLRVALRPFDPAEGWDGEQRERVEVDGHDADLVPLFDDGRIYGRSVSWEVVPGRWVAVEGPEPTTREQVLAAAEGLEPLDDEEWGRFREGLSQHGEVGPEPDEVVAVRGTTGGQDWALAVLAPRDYPLGSDDRRVNCYRFTVAATSTDDNCEQLHWGRVSGQLFVFGAAPVDVERITVRPGMGDDGPELDADTASIDAGPPSSFFAVPLPDDACWVEIRDADDPDGEILAAEGPLPSDPDHPRCLEEIRERDRRAGRPEPGCEQGPPTTAANGAPPQACARPASDG